jgi:hypothetical protein
LEGKIWRSSAWVNPNMLHIVVDTNDSIHGGIFGF